MYDIYIYIYGRLRTDRRAGASLEPPFYGELRGSQERGFEPWST